MVYLPLKIQKGWMKNSTKGTFSARSRSKTRENPRLLITNSFYPNKAEDIFSTLMGDIVEPRRDFIQANALSVSNLDV